jgi:hypothetical protein
VRARHFNPSSLKQAHKKETVVMKASILGLSAALLLGATMIASPSTAFGQSALGSAFTYQGQIKLAGEVVNGTADFQFRLFNSSGGSTQIGSTQSASNVAVANGVFTLPLNFGADAFNGEARWLEIAVRSPAGAGNFVILTPRQPLNAAPYALFSAKPWGTNGSSTFYTNGNVGIGTSSPAAKLDVRSGGGSYWQIDNTNGDLHTNGGTDGVTGFYNDSTAAAARTEIILNGQPHLVVNKAGQVGIGTTAPTAGRRLTVVDGGIFTARFENSHPIGSAVEFVNTASNATWEFGVAGPGIGFGIQPGSMYFYQANDPFGPPMVIAPNHWVGVGSTAPEFRLDLPNIGNADGRGRANQWVTYSSARWKENVETIDGALDMVKQLRGVSFDWKKEHGGSHDIGFVAEEVGRVVPEIVSWEKDGQWAQGLAYDRITALAVEAIKEQQSQIEDLMQANAEMRAQIAELMRHVPAMNGEVHAQVK